VQWRPDRVSRSAPTRTSRFDVGSATSILGTYRHQRDADAEQTPLGIGRLGEYQAHYNSARPHQASPSASHDAGRDAPRAAMTDLDIEQIRRKPVLNGLINEYTHAA